jgi:transglutaminase-like putative cysteine protease
MMTLQTLSFSPAFSNESRITSVQDLKGSDRVVLRIFARSQPSYLVGKVFQEYTNRNTWRAAGKPRIINPVEEKPLSREVREWFPRSEGNVFYLRRGEDWEDASRQAGNHMSVVITSVNTDTLFAPRGVTFALVNSENLRRDIAEVLYTNVKNTRGEYHLAANPSLLPQKNGNETDMAPYLQVPAGISEKITALGDEVAGECNTPWQTCQVFLHFFHSSFTYGAGPKSKSEHALLEDFLLGTRQGHCEFFATAMTLLLRLRGVPARYVNGFLVEEYNHLGGYYVVREKNAHAWVEAYIPEKGWMTFDPTPPTGGSGRRDSLIPLKWREFFDLIMLKVYNIKARLVLGDIKGTIIFLAFQLKAFFLWIFISPLRAVVFILAVTLFCLYRLKKKAIIEILRGRINDKRSGIRLPEEFRVIGEILTQFERLLARKKIRRAPEKTLLEFSGEIKTLPAEQQASVKEFLTHYCLLRYARESIDGQDIADLRKKLAAVKSTIQ